MKKILIILCLLLMIVGCSKSNSVANPMEKHESLEELNELTHGHLCHPGVMGVSDEEYYTIKSGEDLIAEYSFVLNGTKYTVRFSDTVLKDDISGIYIDGKPAFESIDATDAKGEGKILTRWFTVDGQYVMMAEDSVDEPTFYAAVSEIMFLSTNY